MKLTKAQKDLIEMLGSLGTRDLRGARFQYRTIMRAKELGLIEFVPGNRFNGYYGKAQLTAAGRQEYLKMIEHVRK